MSIFKCKMCGGTIEFKQGDTVGTCDSCGTIQTLPRLDDDKKSNLYDRANHFRRNNDFDKAASIYEQILSEDSTDAEAYWSLVLCRYGIEYVEDPTTHKRVPTVNRAQFTSIYADEDYKSAIEYADSYQKTIYENEAKAIDEIQKGILAISQKEEPFDIFICYKETDNNGRRTMDSVLANDLYHQLTQEGFKVFFSRITLEDKLGTAYEPYIFAALNSAKVMVVLGTKPEYFNAVWVKNEWSRYLTLVKESKGKKVLIPAYRDMDPYDLPEEFSHLQAQDMSKLGFMQDLIRGIKKLVNVNSNTTVIKEATVNNTNVNIEPILERAFIFLEDGNFDEADEYFEKVLDQDPKCAQAYLGKLMIDLKVRKPKDLRNQEEPFDNNNNYQRVLRFGDEALSNKLQSYINEINERKENEQKEAIYSSALKNLEYSANYSEEYFKGLSKKFESISGYKNSDELAKECLEKANECRKANIYNKANLYIKANKISSYKSAIEQLEQITDYQDSSTLIDACKAKIEELELAEERRRVEAERQKELARIKAEKRKKKIKLITRVTLIIICIGIAITLVTTKFIIPTMKYNQAIKLAENGEKAEAYRIFSSLNGFKDSEEKGLECYQDYKLDELKNVEIGDTVVFGSYEQDNDTSNGKEEIEWVVLDKQDNKILITSKCALDYKEYNNSTVNITWETSSIRSWLNDEFYNEAFNTNEQIFIEETLNVNEGNSKYGTDGGNDTNDKVFLLSVSDVEKYFDSKVSRKVAPTNYVVNIRKLSSKFSSDDSVGYWLRNTGYKQYCAAYVYSDGDILTSGGRVYDYSGIRPALWINLES